MKPRTPLLFLALAAALHLAGVGLGLLMGATGDYSLRPVHAHLNVLGWTSLGLYALCWNTWPGLGSAVFRRLHLCFSGISAVLLPAGLYLHHSGGGVVLLGIASIGWGAGAALFLVLSVRLCLRSDRCV
jgi:hypothetical protein